MLINKKSIYLLLFIISIFIFSFSGNKNKATSSLTKEGGEWVLKVDDIIVYEDQFNKEYEYALEMSGQPADQIALLKNNQRAKEEFLEGLISQILLLVEAEEKYFFETEQASDFLNTAYRSIKVQYYTQKMMEEVSGEIAEPTQQDIANFYNQYKNELAMEGVVELNAQTIAYLSQLIKGQQAQQQMMRNVTNLKDKSIIEINKDKVTSSLTKEGGEWILKVDDITVYEDQFNKEYEYALQMSGRPEDQIALLKNNQRTKEEFLEGLISQILLLVEAEEKYFFETEGASDFLDTAYRSIKVQYYTQKMLEEVSEEIAEPTQQDIANFYNQYKNELAMEGVVELNAQTIPYLSQLIRGQQAQQQMMRNITDLKNRSVIEINKEIISIQ